MTEIERINQLARWNREEGNLAAAQQLEAFAASLRLAELRQRRTA